MMTEKFEIDRAHKTVTYLQNCTAKFTKPLDEIVTTHGNIETFKNWCVINGISVVVVK